MIFFFLVEIRFSINMINFWSIVLVFFCGGYLFLFKFIYECYLFMEVEYLSVFRFICLFFLLDNIVLKMCIVFFILDVLF